MDDPPDPGVPEAAAEAFGLLGNETRLAVLRALYDAGEPLPFSELRRAVAVEDSGQFNYHLERLVGTFVRSTDAGYGLRYAGEQIVRTVLAGVVATEPSLDPVTVDERCPYCGAPVELSYADEHVTVNCTECAGVADLPGLPRGTFVHFGFPPAAFEDRDMPGVLAAAHTIYDAKVTPMMKGVCPECAGRVAVELDVCPDHVPGEDGLCPECGTRHEVWSIYRCEHCGYRRQAIVWFKLVTYPAVVAFLHEHADLEETIPFNKMTWENARLIGAIDEDVVSTDPVRVRVTIDLDDARLAVTVDESVEIVGLERAEPGDDDSPSLEGSAEPGDGTAESGDGARGSIEGTDESTDDEPMPGSAERGDDGEDDPDDGPR